MATVPADGTREVAAVIRHYSPVAGVLAGSDSESTLAMASELDRLLPEGSHSGKRTLLIVDHCSPAGHVRQLSKEVERSGMHPIGLVYLQREIGPKPRRMLDRMGNQ